MVALVGIVVVVVVVVAAMLPYYLYNQGSIDKR